jgi:hypothetical protein
VRNPQSRCSYRSSNILLSRRHRIWFCHNAYRITASEIVMKQLINLSQPVTGILPDGIVAALTAHALVQWELNRMPTLRQYVDAVYANYVVSSTSVYQHCHECQPHRTMRHIERGRTSHHLSLQCTWLAPYRAFITLASLSNTFPPLRTVSSYLPLSQRLFA